MRRMIVLVGLVSLVTVATAGYAGYEKAQTAVPTAPTKPITVPVTRGDVSRTVTAPGQLVGTHEMMLGLDVDGRLLELAVRPGSIVNAGDVVARLNPAPYEAALADAHLQRTLAEAAYERQLADAELAVEAATAQVESTQAQIPSLTAAEITRQAARDAEAYAAYEYQKAQDRHWEPPEVVEAYRLEWVSIQRAVALAEADYNQILSQQWSVSQQANSLAKGVQQSHLAVDYLANAGVDPRLQLAVDRAQEALDQTVIRAPFAGVVLNVMARPGEQLSAGTNLLLLTDPTQGEVRTTIIEEDLSLIAVGQPAEIYFDARPDVAVAGTVTRIVPQRVEAEARPLYHVFLKLDDPLPAGVYPGMTADASLLIEGVADVPRLPRALVAARSDGTATVDLWQEDAIVTRDIAVGLRGDVYIVVRDGLEAGDEVVGE